MRESLWVLAGCACMGYFGPRCLFSVRLKRTKQLCKGGIEVIVDMDLDPDSLSQVEEAFISAGLL